jgi:hypothetical protein
MFSNFSLYGEALKDLLKSVFNGDVILEPVDTAFQYAIKQTGGDLKFPFISLYPNESIVLDRKNNAMPSYSEGMQFQNPMNVYDDDGSLKGTNKRLAKNAKFLYIIIGYQIDVWATNLFDCEQVVQELLFWLYHNQQIDIEYQGVKLSFSFDVGDEVVNNSDLVSYENTGKIYRYTHSIQVHATLLRSENYFTVIKPNIKIEELK